jgi:hypothetical protein
MSRISRASLIHAIAKVRGMDLVQKTEMIEEVARNQPHVHACVLVQGCFGVSPDKLNQLLYIMLICFQAMKESEHVWPVISENELDRHMAVYLGIAKCGAGTGARGKSLSRYIAEHPERELFSYVHEETSDWLASIVPEETDRYIMIVAATLVTCIAHAPMTAMRPLKPIRRLPMQGISGESFHLLL